MRFTKGGNLDRRFKGVKEGETALVILGILALLAFAALYFIYTYLYIILPLIIIALHFTYLKSFETKYVFYCSLLSMSVYILTLGILVYANIEEPLKLDGSHKNGDKKLTIFDNADFKLRHENRAAGAKYNTNIVSMSRESIELANKYPDSPILAFTKEAKYGDNERIYYGALKKKGNAIYETTLERIYDGYDKPYSFIDGTPTHTLELVIENFNWYGIFKGIKFNLGSIFHPVFVILSGILSIIASFFYYNYFKELDYAKKLT